MYMLFLVAFMVALHQALFWGTWFEMEDIHHETVMVTLVFAGVLVGFIKIEGKASGQQCFGGFK